MPLVVAAGPATWNLIVRVAPTPPGGSSGLARAAGVPVWCDPHDWDGLTPSHPDVAEAADVMVASDGARSGTACAWVPLRARWRSPRPTWWRPGCQPIRELAGLST